MNTENLYLNKNAPIVTCKLIGPSTINNSHNFGLANQMFQVATCVSYAKKNNFLYSIPDLNDKKFGGYVKNIFKEINRFKVKNTLYEYFEPTFEYKEIPRFENVRLNGYFQSEKYFIDNKDIIYEYFQPTSIIDEYIEGKYSKILENSISCHIRLGDYKFLTKEHLNLLDSEYYLNAFEVLNAGEKNILIFSDEINFCKTLKIFNRPNVYFIENESDYLDMMIMSKCKENIIANSTFSWWSAWLNLNIEKKVIAPKSWFGVGKKLNTTDLYPENWIKI